MQRLFLPFPAIFHHSAKSLQTSALGLICRSAHSTLSHTASQRGVHKKGTTLRLALLKIGRWRAKKPFEIRLGRSWSNLEVVAETRVVLFFEDVDVFDIAIAAQKLVL
jgi:hypothetical protein